MSNLFQTLEQLSSDLMEKSKNARTKAAKLAYEDSAMLLLNEINRLNKEIEEDQKAKIEAQMKKFDIHHQDYTTLLSRGHIGIPSNIHAEISSFTVGQKKAGEVFQNLSEDYKHDVLNHLAADKEMIEQLVAYRHNYHYITHTKGHDGIDEDNNVYEVKNRKYVYKKDKRANCDLIFDRISKATERKFREGRPTIIMNMTDGAKLLLEMKIRFSDELLDLYSEKVEALKSSKTSGFAIPFSEYKDYIEEITYVCNDIDQYHIQKQVLDYITLS